jgi:hypothetical protein
MSSALSSCRQKQPVTSKMDGTSYPTFLFRLKQHYSSSGDNKVIDFAMAHLRKNPEWRNLILTANSLKRVGSSEQDEMQDLADLQSDLVAYSGGIIPKKAQEILEDEVRRQASLLSANQKCNPLYLIGSVFVSSVSLFLSCICKNRR